MGLTGKGGGVGGDKQRRPKSGRQRAWQPFVELSRVKQKTEEKAGKSPTEQI